MSKVYLEHLGEAIKKFLCHKISHLEPTGFGWIHTSFMKLMGPIQCVVFLCVCMCMWVGQCGRIMEGILEEVP